MINSSIYSFQKRRNLKIINAKRAKLEEKKKQLHRQLVTNATGEMWPLEVCPCPVIQSLLQFSPSFHQLLSTYAVMLLAGGLGRL